MSTAVATAVELVTFAPESRRALGLFAALENGAAAHGIDFLRSTTYTGSRPWVLLWGAGAPARAAVLHRHVSGGGHVLAFDLAYWDRDRKVRVSIDAPHPVTQVMRMAHSPSRLRADGVRTSDTWNPTGKIVIAGLGDKARVQYGADVVDRWEAAMARVCRERWPSRPVVYRKKKAGSPVPGWATVAPGQPIETVLQGASLVITWHSNVAVDAIRQGIPVICRDGAAAAVCPSVLGPSDPVPLPSEIRAQFLANLAWFQWGTTPQEAVGFWKFVQERLS